MQRINVVKNRKYAKMCVYRAGIRVGNRTMFSSAVARFSTFGKTCHSGRKVYGHSSFLAHVYAVETLRRKQCAQANSCVWQRGSDQLLARLSAGHRKSSDVVRCHTHVFAYHFRINSHQFASIRINTQVFYFLRFCTFFAFCIGIDM